MKPKTLGRQLLLAALLMVMASGALAVTERIFTVVTNGGMVNHWPGPDGLIGTIDDHVSGANSPVHDSLPNENGSLSYNAFWFEYLPFEEPLHLPTGMNAVTFVEGTIVGDMDVAASGGGPIVLDWNVTGTEPYAGHGPYSSTILDVDELNSSYDAGTHAFTLRIDFQAELVYQTDSSLDFDITGTAWMIDADDFGTATGVPYIDDVLIPLAQGLNATGLFFLQGSGTIPASEHGLWEEMPMQASFFGISRPETPAQPSNWSTIKSLFR